MKTTFHHFYFYFYFYTRLCFSVNQDSCINILHHTWWCFLFFTLHNRYCLSPRSHDSDLVLLKCIIVCCMSVLSVTTVCFLCKEQRLYSSGHRSVTLWLATVCVRQNSPNREKQPHLVVLPATRVSYPPWYIQYVCLPGSLTGSVTSQEQQNQHSVQQLCQNQTKLQFFCSKKEHWIKDDILSMTLHSTLYCNKVHWWTALLLYLIARRSKVHSVWNLCSHVVWLAFFLMLWCPHTVHACLGKVESQKCP